MEEEFERIVREYRDKIFRLAYSMLGDRGAAEEAAHLRLVFDHEDRQLAHGILTRAS